ncbi:MAG: hypothetical protein ACMXX6_00410 [Candidatus Woesearchaeota archaeon]
MLEMQSNSDFLTIAINLMNLGARLYDEAQKGKEHFYNYCIENKEEIMAKISGKSSEINYDYLLKSDFVKSNFSELSDYVVRYYDETKRAK